MKSTRWARLLVLGATLAAASVLLGSCTVDKKELARRIELKNVDLAAVPDGVYESRYTIVVPSAAANKTVKVRVTVKDGRYQTIEVLEPASLAGRDACKKLISRVEETQSLSLDAVSGATITSAAVLKAIQTAVSTH
jgi:urocanate reductase